MTSIPSSNANLEKYQKHIETLERFFGVLRKPVSIEDVDELDEVEKIFFMDLPETRPKDEYISSTKENPYPVPSNAKEYLDGRVHVWREGDYRCIRIVHKKGIQTRRLYRPRKCEPVENK